MTNPAFQDSEVLKFILEPLLEDFVYWFGRSLLLLEQEEINFLTEPQKTDLITRVKHNLEAVKTAKMMYKLSGEKVGIEVQAMMPWHKLLMECQAVGMRFRQSQAT
jgi:LmbE family N-acetylglucosaminyl deacetylase